MLSLFFSGKMPLSEQLCLEICSLTRLCHLDLSWHSIRSHAAFALARSLREMQSLQFLSLASCDFSPRALAAITSCFGSLPSLELLDMPDCGLPNHYVIHDIAPALQALTSVTLVAFGGNTFGDAGISALARALVSARKLKHLDVAGTEPLGERSANALADLLATRSSLRSVNVRGRDITVADALVLLQALDESDPLRCFELAEACRAVIPDNDDSTEDLIQSVLLQAHDDMESSSIWQ